MKKKGFTLIELIIVVIILGILAAIGIPQYIKAIEKARGAEGYAGLGYIQSGEKLYYANNEQYYQQTPLDDTGEQMLDINLPQSGWTFAIAASVPPAAPTFTATATRARGQCATHTMTMTQLGVLNDVDWRTCQEGL